MSIAAIRPRAHYERGLAHLHERRSPQGGVSSSVAPLPATTSIVDPTQATATPNPETATAINLPTSLKALSGLITVLGLFILAVAIWKIRAWRRHRSSASSKWVTIDEKQAGFAIRIDLESATTEKPSKAVLKPIVPPASAGVGWTPQLRADIALPKPTKRSKRNTKAWENNLAKFMSPTIPEREPPPSYIVANIVPRTLLPPHVPLPPVPEIPTQAPSVPLPPTPPASCKLTFDAVIPPPPTQKAKLNPARTFSQGLHPTPAAGQSSSSTKNEKKLPRLMSVKSTFDRSLEDELLIVVGETVRLLEEYEDEWCLVQRVGRVDAQKGIIPRLCLTERPEIVPTYPSAGFHRR